MLEAEWNDFKRICAEAETDGNESVELWTSDFRHLLDTIEVYDQMLREATTYIDPASRLSRRMSKALYVS